MGGGKMLTAHVKWYLEPGLMPVIDVKGKDTIRDVKQKVGRALCVSEADFVLFYEGEAMGDMASAVCETGLVEGCVVEAVPSKQFEAKMELKEMGLVCSAECLFKKVLASNEIASSEEEKARITLLMAECGTVLDIPKPLVYASGKGYAQVAEVLAPLGDVDAISRIGFFEVTPLVEAACKGQLNVIKVLLSHRADVNKPGGFGRTPLHVAAASCHVNVVRELLACNADVDTTDDKGLTAMHSAAYHGFSEVLEMLVVRSKRWPEWEGKRFEEISRLLEDEYARVHVW
eukprot:TRINITY_DN38948_c0_g1_i1.p1 TRINITY_DN38948_c0_g1~~TRINITY_DN38948_c0_g1_i1.p1  ORF type:complete len:312 (+),score=80.77 TRINITY_DN38948_c0_g1_i1:75-938(+)